MECKKEDGYKLTAIFPIKFNIDKVFDLFRNNKLVAEIWKDNIHDLTIKEGLSFMIVGTEVIFQYKDIATISMIVEQVIDDKYYKRIQLFANKIKPFMYEYRYVYELYSNTSEECTMMVLQNVFADKEIVLQVNAVRNYEAKYLMIKRLESIMTSRCVEKDQIESVIIMNTSYTRICKMIKDLRKLQKIVVRFAREISYSKEENTEEIGNEIIIRYKDSINSYKVKACEDDGMRCRYVIEGGVIGNAKDLNYIIEYEVIKVNDSTCYLSIKHVYYTPQTLKELSKVGCSKKRILEKLKERIEEGE